MKKATFHKFVTYLPKIKETYDVDITPRQMGYIYNLITDLICSMTDPKVKVDKDDQFGRLLKEEQKTLNGLVKIYRDQIEFLDSSPERYVTDQYGTKWKSVFNGQLYKPAIIHMLQMIEGQLEYLEMVFDINWYRSPSRRKAVYHWAENSNIEVLSKKKGKTGIPVNPRGGEVVLFLMAKMISEISKDSLRKETVGLIIWDLLRWDDECNGVAQNSGINDLDNILSKINRAERYVEDGTISIEIVPF